MKRNLAAALGEWSARHRKTAILGWLAFVVLASVLGGAAGQITMSDEEMGAGETARAQRILAEAGIDRPAEEMVLLHSDRHTAGDPTVRRAAAAVTANIRATGLVQDIRQPLVSKDRHDVLIQYAIKGDPDESADHVQPVLDAVARAERDNPGVTAGEYGAASAQKWFDDLLGKDFQRAEMTALPLALGILLVAFGALLAAVLPVVLAFTAFLAALGLLGVASHLVHLDAAATSVMLLVGLAVGVDYCLFYLRREREERAAGRDADAALRIAAATSGRSVLVSGLTVMVAMAGMFLSGLLIFKGFAVATILVVLIAMLGSVTVLPALLSLLGDRVELGRIPLLRRRSRGGGRPGGEGAVGRLLRPVLARPGVAAVLSAGLLLALAAPALGLKTESLGLDKQVPADTELVKTYERINRSFPGGPAPAIVVVKARDVKSPEVTRAIADLRKEALGTGEMHGPIDVTVHASANIAEIEVPLAGDGTNDAAKHALETLRDRVVPRTVGKVADAPVEGELAFSVDYNDQLRGAIVPVFLFVLGITFLLMLVFFRSVVVALTAIVLNLLSVGATYGVMVAVFQHGWGDSLVGTEGAGALESWIPLFVFVVLFGLSMDYHVFVVSRIREVYDRGLDTTRAVAEGVRATAGVVTSAAVIMIATFAVFGTLSIQDFKQLGVGLAVAVLVDATIVRVVLLPSVMSLLGRANWYLPTWLERLLPRISHGEEPSAPGPAPGPAPAHAHAAAIPSSGPYFPPSAASPPPPVRPPVPAPPPASGQPHQAGPAYAPGRSYAPAAPPYAPAAPADAPAGPPYATAAPAAGDGPRDASVTAGGSWRSRFRRTAGAPWRGLLLWSLTIPTMVAFTALVTALSLVSVGVGILLMPPTLVAVRGLLNHVRELAGRWTGSRIERPYRPDSGPDGPWPRFARLMSDPATWRDLVWMLLDPIVALCTAALPVLLILYGAFGWLLSAGLGRVIIDGGGQTWFGFVNVHGDYADDSGRLLMTAALGTVLVALGFLLGPALLNAYGRWVRLLLGPASDRPSR